MNKDKMKEIARELVMTNILFNGETQANNGLRNVNSIQEELEMIKNIKLYLGEKLESEGWEIEFSIENPISDFSLDNNFIVLAETDDIILCRATKEVEKDKKIVIEKTARLADGDVYIELLGEYLALARVYTAIKE